MKTESRVTRDFLLNDRLSVTRNQALDNFPVSRGTLHFPTRPFATPENY